MSTEMSFESVLRDLLTPIIRDAVRIALAEYGSPAHESRESNPDLMDVKMTAALLHLSVPTIYGLVHKRSIPFYKRGQRLYFKREDIEKWVDAGRRMTVDEIREAAAQSLTGRVRRR